MNYLKLSDVREVIKDKLGLLPEELSGVQKIGKRYEFGIKQSKTFYDKNVLSFVDKKYTLTSGKIIELTQAYEESTTVRVTKMPMYFSYDKVQRIFTKYGTLKKIEEEKWKVGTDDPNDYDGLWNGNYRIKMIVEKPIPSTLEVDGRRFEIFYPGQDKTCFRCGRDHLISVAGCQTPRSKHVNRFVMDDFPPLPSVLAPPPPPPPPL